MYFLASVIILDYISKREFQIVIQSTSFRNPYAVNYLPRILTPSPPHTVSGPGGFEEPMAEGSVQPIRTASIETDPPSTPCTGKLTASCPPRRPST